MGGAAGSSPSNWRLTMTNFNAFTVAAMIKFAEERNVKIPAPARCGHHPIAVRKQYIIDAVRKAGF